MTYRYSNKIVYKQKFEGSSSFSATVLERLTAKALCNIILFMSDMICKPINNIIHIQVNVQYIVYTKI